METIEEGTLSVRVPRAAYQLLRNEAFRLHKPMTRVIEEIITQSLPHETRVN